MYAAEAKGQDAGDAQKLMVIRYRAMQVLNQARRRGKVIDAGRRGKRRLWALPGPLPLAPE